MLDRARAHHQHGRARGQPARRADDVEELLEPHVGAEPGLGHHHVGEFERDPVGDQRVVAVRDVRERAAVHQARLALERLDQVRLHRFLEQYRHRARGTQCLRGHRVAVGVVADGDGAEALPQVVQVAADRQQGHDLAGGGDVEPGLALDAVDRSALADGDVAQRPVVHVDRPPPRDPLEVQAQRVAVLQGGVEHRGQQVVGGADGVHVPREMEVDVLHRDDLRVPAAGRAALDSEHRPDRRLPQACERVDADLGETLCEADQRRRLALAHARRRDAGHAHQLAVGTFAQTVQDAERHLRLVAPVELDLVGLQAGLQRDLLDRLRLRLLGDLETGCRRRRTCGIGKHA